MPDIPAAPPAGEALFWRMEAERHAQGAAPPASGPQEAATPVEALAAEMTAERDRWRAAAADTPDIDMARGRSAIAHSWTQAAALLRERLAPAWDALARERDRLARIVDNDGVELNRIIAATGEFSDANGLAHDVERMARAALKFGEARHE